MTKLDLFINAETRKVLLNTEANSDIKVFSKPNT
jgi:hypothetical protein